MQKIPLFGWSPVSLLDRQDLLIGLFISGAAFVNLSQVPQM